MSEDFAQAKAEGKPRRITDLEEVTNPAERASAAQAGAGELIEQAGGFERVSPDAQQPMEAHHMLNNPLADPDPTEYPDPYEQRPDPRGPETVPTVIDSKTDQAADSVTTSQAVSDSEPHPPDFDDDPGMGRTRSGSERRPGPGPVGS
jgi:hypothetical protein